MAEKTAIKRLDSEVNESDNGSDSDNELDSSQPEGTVQIGQGNSVVTYHNTNDIVQNINVNMTTNIYVQDGHTPVIMKRQQSLVSNQSSSSQTNSLDIDLGQFGSVRIPLPVSSPEEATTVRLSSDAQSESQSQDLHTLSDGDIKDLQSSKENPLQRHSPKGDQRNQRNSAFQKKENLTSSNSETRIYTQRRDGGHSMSGSTVHTGTTAAGPEVDTRSRKKRSTISQFGNADTTLPGISCYYCPGKDNDISVIVTPLPSIR